MGYILFGWKRVVEDVIWLDGSVWRCYLGGWVFTGVIWLRNGCLVMLIGWEGFDGGLGDWKWVRHPYYCMSCSITCFSEYTVLVYDPV